MMRAICRVQLKDRNRSTDLMFMPGLNENIDQLAMANGFNWYDHVLSREDGHVLRRALDIEVKCQKKNGGRIGHGRSWLRKKVRRMF